MQQFEAFGWLTRLDRHGPAHPRRLRTSGLGARFAEDLKREEAARAALTAAIKAGAGRTVKPEPEPELEPELEPEKAVCQAGC